MWVFVLSNKVLTWLLQWGEKPWTELASNNFSAFHQEETASFISDTEGDAGFKISLCSLALKRSALEDGRLLSPQIFTYWRSGRAGRVGHRAKNKSGTRLNNQLNLWKYKISRSRFVKRETGGSLFERPWSVWSSSLPSGHVCFSLSSCCRVRKSCSLLIFNLLTCDFKEINICTGRCWRAELF